MPIARRYRGGKPRIYTPYLTQSDLANRSQWATASTTALTTAWLAFITAIKTHALGSATVTGQVNVGYFSGYTLGPAGPGGYRTKIPTPLGTPHVDVITGTTTNLKPASQRRRNLHSA